MALTDAEMPETDNPDILHKCEEKIMLRVNLSRQRESLLTEGQQRKQRGEKLTVKISITVYKPRNYRAPPTLRLRDESVD